MYSLSYCFGYLRRIECKLDDLKKIGDKIMASLDDILKAVEEQTTVTQSAIVLLNQLEDLILAGQQDPAKLQSALDLIQKNKQELADAVAENTPGA